MGRRAKSADDSNGAIPGVVGYARVSSREQAINSSALDQQIARLRGAGAEFIISDVESARGGKEGSRDGYQQLINNPAASGRGMNSQFFDPTYAASGRGINPGQD
jgi:predicted site-specific integrase-resolvase